MDAHMTEAEIHYELIQDFIQNKSSSTFEMEHFLYVLENLKDCLIRCS